MHRTKMRENTSIKIDLQSFESENGASSIIDRVDSSEDVSAGHAAELLQQWEQHLHLIGTQRQREMGNLVCHLRCCWKFGTINTVQD